MTRPILIIGGYGNFGRFIARRLDGDGIRTVIAGRSRLKASRLAETLQHAEPASLDIDGDLDAALRQVDPLAVIHTSGPYQGQDYRVARACIAQGCHYIDLADARGFVAGIGALDAEARGGGVAAISGASSVPCLSAALVDHYRGSFRNLESLDYGITTAQKTNRGLATTAAILSYVGRPFQALRDGREERVYGWQGFRLRRYRRLGWRCLGLCDVPDLALFPARYPELSSIRFAAGLELPPLHLGLWALSWLVRLGLIRRLERAAPPLLAASRLFDVFGSADSGFHMEMRGEDLEGRERRLVFELTARSGDGPYIPCIPAILLASRLARGEAVEPGARPCLGLIGLDDYLGALEGLAIEWEADWQDE